MGKETRAQRYEVIELRSQGWACEMRRADSAQASMQSPQTVVGSNSGGHYLGAWNLEAYGAIWKAP